MSMKTVSVKCLTALLLIAAMLLSVVGLTACANMTKDKIDRMTNEELVSAIEKSVSEKKKDLNFNVVAVGFQNEKYMLLFLDEKSGTNIVYDLTQADYDAIMQSAGELAEELGDELMAFSPDGTSAAFFPDTLRDDRMKPINQILCQYLLNEKSYEIEPEYQAPSEPTGRDLRSIDAEIRSMGEPIPDFGDPDRWKNYQTGAVAILEIPEYEDDSNTATDNEDESTTGFNIPQTQMFILFIDDPYASEYYGGLRFLDEQTLAELYDAIENHLPDSRILKLEQGFNGQGYLLDAGIFEDPSMEDLYSIILRPEGFLRPCHSPTPFIQ